MTKQLYQNRHHAPAHCIFITNSLNGQSCINSCNQLTFKTFFFFFFKIFIQLILLAHCQSHLYKLCKYINFKVYGNTSLFFCHFENEKSLCSVLFASVGNSAFPKWNLLIKERIFFLRSKSFQKGGQNEYGRIACPESESIYLKTE